MLQNSMVTAFNVFELLGENQLVLGGGVKLPLPPRIGLSEWLFTSLLKS